MRVPLTAKSQSVKRVFYLEMIPCSVADRALKFNYELMFHLFIKNKNELCFALSLSLSLSLCLSVCLCVCVCVCVCVAY